MLTSKSKVAKFVILFEGRTGSSYLLSILNAHPQIRAYGEELVRLKNAGFDAQEEWIRRALTPYMLSRHKAIGFKTKLRDIAAQDRFKDLLEELQPTIIHMQRRNRVKVAISEVNANLLHEKIGKYNAESIGERLPPHRIELDDFRYALTLREDLDSQLLKFVHSMSLETLDIFYEDILLDKEATIKKIYNTLKVKYKPASAVTVKNTSDNLRESIVNLDELKNAYLGTQYEPMFDEITSKKPHGV